MISASIILLAALIGLNPRETAMSDVARGNDQFACDLYRRVAGLPGNLVFSPYSISEALAMVRVGARGTTEAEIAATLHLPGDGKVVEAGFAALRASLEAKGAADRPRLRIANALWGQQGLHYRREFLDRAEAAFGAGLHPVDFFREPDSARKMINAWVASRTFDKIPDLLAPSDVTRDSDLILTNAIYFQGAWSVPFSKSSTRDEPFQAANGPVDVPMMHRTGSFGYREGEGFQALDIPYVAETFSMTILLPNIPGGLAALEEGLSASKIEGWLANLTPRQVDVALPRFRVEARVDLVGSLTALGMGSAFGKAADFSGITTDRGLYLSGVIHQAFARVDEDGTEAAGATAAVMMRKSAMMVPKPAVSFRADRPFLFLIRDVRSGSILFLGRVANPKP